MTDDRSVNSLLVLIQLLRLVQSGRDSTSSLKADQWICFTVLRSGGLIAPLAS